MKQHKPLRARIVRRTLVRKLVFERDGGFCAHGCGFDARWQHDHVTPLFLGGKDTLENSQTLCRRCHLSKSVGETPIRAKTDRLAARSELTKQRRAIR